MVPKVTELRTGQIQDDMIRIVRWKERVRQARSAIMECSERETGLFSFGGLKDI